MCILWCFPKVYSVKLVVLLAEGVSTCLMKRWSESFIKFKFNECIDSSSFIKTIVCMNCMLYMM